MGTQKVQQGLEVEVETLLQGAPGTFLQICLLWKGCELDKFFFFFLKAVEATEGVSRGVMGRSEF